MTSQLRQTLHHLSSAVSKKIKERKKNLWSTLSDGYTTSIIIRQPETVKSTAMPPTSALPARRVDLNHYHATAAAKNIFRAFSAESAHRQYYLISTELFQMKCEGVSHSAGLFCVLAQCVGFFYDSCVASVKVLLQACLNHRCSLAGAPRGNCWEGEV